MTSATHAEDDRTNPACEERRESHHLGPIEHKTEQTMKNEPQSSVLLYQSSDGATRLEVRMEDETVWLSQNQMAELFQTSIPNVRMHIRNVFAEGELQPASVVKEFLIAAADGKNYQTKFYNLDVIISVGMGLSPGMRRHEGCCWRAIRQRFKRLSDRRPQEDHRI